jgi:fatty acid hydroxylase domain-containing protein 2
MAPSVLRAVQDVAFPLVFFALAQVCISTYGSSLWSSLVARGLSTPFISFLLVGVAPFVVYYAYGIPLLLLDLHPALEGWRRAHKLQDRARITKEDVYRVLRVTLANWLLVGLPVSAALSWWAMPLRGASSGAHDVPTAAVFVRDLVVTLLCEEVLFYASHRTLHANNELYARVHKQHHEFYAPFGLAAVYAHPLEHLVSNVLPVAAGPLLMGSHPLFSLAWTTLALINTITSHSGYALPFMHRPLFHDYHHEHLSECFGVLEVLDSWCGTDKGYRRALEAGELDVPRGTATATGTGTETKGAGGRRRRAPSRSSSSKGAKGRR